MSWKSSSTVPAWKSGTTNYDATAGSGFSVTEAPAAVRRGATFEVECVGLETAPTATLGGHSITVNSFTETSISLTIPESHDAKHATSRTLSITADDITRSVQVNYLPPVGWSYVNFVNPTNDLAIAAFAQMLDGDDNPVLVEEGEQGVYENTVDAGLETWTVLIDPDNTIAVNSGGAPLQGNSLRAYLITDTGRGTEGIMVLDALDTQSENSPPTWDSTPDLTEFAGNTFTFNIGSYASDADGDNLTFAKVSGDVGIAVSSGGVVSGTIEEPGTYPLVVSVTDGNSPPVTGTFNIVIAEVIPGNNPPVWNTTPLLKGDIGEAFSMDVSQYASDADNDPLTFAKTGGNSAVSVSTNGIVSGTINIAGTFPIGISVSDGKAPPVQGIFNLFIATELAPITGEIQVAYNSTTKLVTLQPEGAIVPPGSELIGGFDHTEEGDPLGYVGNHVIYHHVQDLLYKVGEYNMQAVRIIQDSDPTFSEGG